MVKLAILKLTRAKHGGGMGCCQHVVKVSTGAMEDGVYRVEVLGGGVAMGGNRSVTVYVRRCGMCLHAQDNTYHLYACVWGRVRLFWGLESLRIYFAPSLATSLRDGFGTRFAVKKR